MTINSQLGPNTPLVGKVGSREELATPALLLDLDALERNLSTMSGHCKAYDLALRPHAKTHKSARIAQLQADAGAVGICVASLREASVMVEAGVSGVHLTSPIVGKTKCDLFASLIDLSDGLSTVVDNMENLKELESCVQSRGKKLTVLVDVDIDAMHRTGVKTANEAISLARSVQDSGVLDYAGIQFYSGIVQHITTPHERSKFYEEQLDRLSSLLDKLNQEGSSADIVSGGGTGTFHIDARSGLFTENQAGSYVFMDVEYGDVQLLPGISHPFETALLVQTTVISNNSRGLVTTDAGFKSLATDGPMPRILKGATGSAMYRYFGDEFGMVLLGEDAKFPESNEELQAAMQEAEPHELFYRHFGQLKGEPGGLPVGAKLELITPHCDPTVNLHNYYHCVRGDTLVDIWPVDARGSL